jgi:hypothetical protein
MEIVQVIFRVHVAIGYSFVQTILGAQSPSVRFLSCLRREKQRIPMRAMAFGDISRSRTSFREDVI